MTERPIIVHLRDTVSGATRAYETAGTWDGAAFIDYPWSEGNFGCDCNRSLFLWEWDEEKVLECNVERPRIAIDRIVRADTGEVVYAERGA